MARTEFPELTLPSPNLDEVLLVPSTRGGGEIPLEIQVLRELTEEDLGTLSEVVTTKQPTIMALKQSHHQLAQLLAIGVPGHRVSLITGYNEAYISRLKSDPAFVDLMAHYAGQKEVEFAQALEQMQVLGLNTLGELRDRLENDPEAWTNRELMDLAELTLVKPLAAKNAGGGGGTGGSPAVNVQVSFVQAPRVDLPGGRVIDMEGRQT